MSISQARLVRVINGDPIVANALYTGDPNTTAEPDYSKAGPMCLLKVGEGDYRGWYEGVRQTKLLDPDNQPGVYDFDTVVCYVSGASPTSLVKRDNNANGIVDAVASVTITPTNPPGGSLAWMRAETSPGTVLYDPDAALWKMWGHGGNNTLPRAIFYATSSDGFAWTFQNNGQPVLEKGAPGSWKETAVSDARVIRLSSTNYVMLYRGGPGVVPQIGRATSTDGVTWTDQSVASPAIAVGGGGAWDSGAVYPLGVLLDPATQKLHAWYGGGTSDNGGVGLGYVGSDDYGATWTKGPANPLISTSASGLDSVGLGDTISALKDGRAILIHYGSEKDAPPYFRGRLMARVDLSTGFQNYMRVHAGSGISVGGIG